MKLVSAIELKHNEHTAYLYFSDSSLSYSVNSRGKRGSTRTYIEPPMLVFWFLCCPICWECCPHKAFSSQPLRGLPHLWRTRPFPRQSISSDWWLEGCKGLASHPSLGCVLPSLVQLWRAILAPELPMGLAEAVVVSASQLGFSPCPLPSLPQVLIPRAVLNKHPTYLRVCFPGNPTLQPKHISL